MKTIGKAVISIVLLVLARAVVRRYRPKIVMVTGSVGKTSTKDAVASVLMSRYFVRKSEKSFNSEFGVPFTILGVENPWHNPFAWLTIFRRAIGLLLLPNHYPTLLVLEVGSGKPGDLAHILRIATPDMVVVTSLPEIPVHVEAYASPAAVREEEFSPAYALAAEAPLIVPADEPYANEAALSTPARRITFGTSRSASVQIGEGKIIEEHGVVIGMGARVVVGEETGEVLVRGSVGATQLLPAAAALASGIALGIPLTEALEALEGYEPPPGRGRLLRGLHDSVLIDDSYNSSPAAVEQALATLSVFPHAKRRIAVLGDMLELGRYSVDEHQRIAQLVDTCVDVVVAIGIRMRVVESIVNRAEVLLFDSAKAAALALPERIQEGDVILIKGSQSIRTERIVEALLADPSDARLLVRQERAWKKKK